ncbi:MAG: hypothetical protein ACON41_00755 [Parvibaculales bacterium]
MGAFGFSSKPDFTPHHFSGAGEPDKRVLSLGAGVQSTVMALMADKGMFGHKPDVAVFADTGWEPEQVYKHLDWLEKQLSYPIIKTTVKYTPRKRPRDQDGKFISANLREHLMNGVNSSGNKFVTVPLYMLNMEGKPAIGRRQCTREYKVTPIQKTIRREILQVKPRRRLPDGVWVEQWLGISTDEMVRMKDNREHWIINRWPLIEAANMSRQDCKDWFKEHYPRRALPRSACVGCPLRTHAEWLDMKKNDPESWNEAVAFDEALREGSRVERFGKEMYLTNKRIPLKELGKMKVDKKSKKKPRKMNEECEGMCGV